MTDSKIWYRPYKDGDEQAILDLYNGVFARPQTLRQWRWAYESNPVRRMDMILAFAGQKLVGHSAGIPLRASHDGRPVNTSRIQNVLVHADFRGKGIFAETLVRLTDQLRANAVDFVLTYPNDNSLPGFMKLGRYTHQCDIFQFHGDASTAGQPTASDITVLVDDGPAFEDRDVAFISRALAPFGIYNIRDLTYLRWRYGRDSGYRYRVFRAVRGSEMIGFAVTKVYPDGRSLDLVEFIVGEDALIARSILSSILTAYGSDGAGGFNVWSMEHYPEFPGLVDMGVTRSDRAAHVVWTALSAQASPRSGSATAYYLSMGDSDVF